MADIRINAIATTATDFASDDYIAIDGTANGTRKVNAKTANLTFGDVRFGTSGPSAKSSIAARAARQGLVGNGTAESTATLTSALGSTDKSLAVTVLVNEAGNGIFHFGTSNATVARQLQVLLLNTRKLRVELLGATTSDIRQANTDSAIADNGKFAHVVCTISGSTLTIYVNGVSVSYTEVTAGTPPAWSDAVNGTAVEIGGTAGANLASTTLETPYVYNRALSAAEVVSLYEAGVPSGADYNNAGTAFTTGTFANSGYSTFSGASATGFVATYGGGGEAGANSQVSNLTVSPGRKYLIKFDLTLTSGTAPYVGLAQFGVQWLTGSAATTTGQVRAAAGSNSIVVTIRSVNATFASGAGVGFASQEASSFTVANLTATPLGLLLAPDAAQAGGGLTWYDTSGNAANITLPASGVTWNVPSSLKTASGWTFGGNLTVSGTGTSSFATGALVKLGLPTYAPNGNLGGNLLQLKSAGGFAYLTIGNGDSANSTAYIGGASAYTTFGTVSDAGVTVENARIVSNGNVLLGTTTDSGNGKLQLATHTTSAGGIGFGTDTQIFRTGSNSLKIDSGKSGAQASPGVVYLDNSYYNQGTAAVAGLKLNLYGAPASGEGYGLGLGSTANLFVISANSGGTGNIQLATGTGNIALTLDSSQNATFAGTGASQFKGTLLVGNQGAIGASLDVQTASGTASTFRLYQNGVSNWVWSVPASTDALVLSQYGTTEAMRFNSSRVAIFAGPVRLANAYTAGVVVTTGYVTIQDSSGTTYKIPVGT